MTTVLQFQFAAICRFFCAQTETLSGTVASQWSFLLRGFHFLFYAFLTGVFLPFLAVLCSILFTTNGEWYWWLGCAVVALTSMIAGRDLHALRQRVDLELE